MAPVQRKKLNGATVSDDMSSATAQPQQSPPIDISAILAGNFGSESAMEVAVQPAKSNGSSRSAQLRALAEEMTAQVADAESLSFDEREAMRKRILEASIESLRAALPEDRQSLGALVANLNDSFSEIGEEFARVQEFNQDEQRIIDRAKESHSVAVSVVASARVKLQEAGTKWNLFGRRDAAIVTAKAEIDRAEAAERTAFGEIETATKAAEEVRSERLQTADFEQSFATITACVEKTKSVLLERISALIVQSTAALKKKEESYSHKQLAATNMEQYQAKVEEIKATYDDACRTRDSFEVGSSARAEQEAKVSTLQREYEEARAQHDQQLVVFQSMEKATKSLEIGEAALRAGLHAHKVTLAQLVADSDVWVVEFKNRVAQIRAMASQQASSDLIQLGSAVRRENAKRSAEFAIGSLANITEQAERHPGEMEDIGAIASAMAEGLQSVASRWRTIEAKTREAGGIPPSASE